MAHKKKPKKSVKSKVMMHLSEDIKESKEMIRDDKKLKKTLKKAK